MTESLIFIALREIQKTLLAHIGEGLCSVVRPHFEEVIDKLRPPLTSLLDFNSFILLRE